MIAESAKWLAGSHGLALAARCLSCLLLVRSLANGRVEVQEHIVVMVCVGSKAANTTFFPDVFCNVIMDFSQIFLREIHWNIQNCSLCCLREMT